MLLMPKACSQDAEKLVLGFANSIVSCLFQTIHHFRLIVDAVVELSDVVKKHENRHSLDEL